MLDHHHSPHLSATHGHEYLKWRERVWCSHNLVTAVIRPSSHGGSRVFHSRREQPWAPLERSNPRRRPRRMTPASGSVVQRRRPHGSALTRATHFRWLSSCHEPAPLLRRRRLCLLESWASLGAHPSFLRRGAHSTGNHTALHVYKRGGRGGPWPKERILGRGGADGRVAGVGGRASREVQGAQGLN